MSLAGAGGKCILCGSDKAELIMSGPDRLMGLEGIYSVYRCSECGLARTSPQIVGEEGAMYYAPDDLAESGQSDRIVKYQSRLAARVDKAVTSQGTRKVLDLGCGEGVFLELMRDRGWETAGIELGEESSRIAREDRGLDVITGDVFAGDFADAEFDAVVMSHILEHLPDPVAALNRVSDLLRPGGTLMLSLPNYRSPEAKLFGKNWYCWVLPPHLYHFSRNAVSKALGQADLEVDKVTYLPFFFIVQNLRYVMGRDGAHKPARGGVQSDKSARSRKSGLKDAAKTVVFRSLLTLADLAGRVMPGEIMEIEARKPARK